MLSTTKKFAKSVYAWITSKCCEDGISQPLKWEIFSVLPSTFPLLMWRFEFTSCSMSYIPPWATEAGAALCMLGALHWSYNAQKPFYRCIHIYIYSSRKFLVKKKRRDLPPEISLSAFCFGMAIWNDWKRKSSSQEVMHKSGNQTKYYNWSAGLKCECQSAVANQHHRHEKCTCVTSCWYILRHKINNKKIQVESVVIWS